MVAYGNRQKRNSVCVSKQLRFVAITETFNGNQTLEKGRTGCDGIPLALFGGKALQTSAPSTNN